MVVKENNLVLQNEQGIIQSDGFALRYSIEGRGKNAIVIGSAIYYPRTFSENLRNYLRMAFIDHRGFAATSNLKETSLEEILDDIEKMRRELNLGEVIIIGHSGHGFMALEYAKRYPQNVSHVVLIAMGPSNSAEIAEATEQYWQASLCPQRKLVLAENIQKLAADIEAEPERRFIHFCLRYGARSWYDFTFDATPLWAGVEINMPIIDHIWGEVFRDIDISGGLENFTKPVFLALGKFDFLVAPAICWEEVADKFHNLTIRVFDHSGHTPQLEEAGLFDAELLSWFNNN